MKSWVLSTFELSNTHITYDIQFVEVEEGIIFEDEQFIVTALELEHVIQCFGYRIEQKPLQGELLIEKARELGVPKGPLLGKLKNGENITLENGTVVYSKDVTAPPKEGFVVSILGDTKYCGNAIKLSENADIVVHEATFDHNTAELAASYGHSTNLEAAKIAKEAHAENLILNHLSARFLFPQIQALVTEAKGIFPNTFIANDFDEFLWKNNKLLKV